MDELKRVIGDASEGPGPLKVHRLSEKQCAGIANAVRALLTSPEAVERVARGLDPEIWAIDLPVPTRDATNNFHARRKASCNLATAALTALLGDTTHER